MLKHPEVKFVLTSAAHFGIHPRVVGGWLARGVDRGGVWGGIRHGQMSLVGASCKSPGALEVFTLFCVFENVANEMLRNKT